jgi:NAD(P)-dependent dehydrogenase (short-subunit alcohol dehydrogenase family)
MEYIRSLFNVENKVVVITGGSGILGTEMASGFLCAGAKVVLFARNGENLKKKVAALGKKGSVVIGLHCDVTSEENMRSVNEEILKKFGRIDVLINAAGGNVAGATWGRPTN